MNHTPLDETQLQALLRLKRYEQPPQRYFDDLLAQVHRRQREELLRRPAWAIAADRVRAFFASLRVDWKHAGSMAALLVVGIAAIRVALPDKSPRAQIASTPNSDKGSAPAPERAITFEPRTANASTAESSKRAVKHFEPADSDGPTRFIIDTQPVSYEANEATPIRF